MGDALSLTSPVLNDSNPVVFRNVSISNNPLPNQPFDLNTVIKVAGSHPQDILLFVSVPAGISFLSPEIVNLENVSEKDAEEVVTWRLLALDNGSFRLNITAYFMGNSTVNANNSGFISFPIDISVGFRTKGDPHFQLKDVIMYPPLAYPGSIGTKLNINMLNIGDMIANNVTAELKLPPGLSSTAGMSNIFYIGRMLPTENFTLSYFINIGSNITSNVYPLSVVLKYNNGSTALNTAISIAPKAKFEIIDVVRSDQIYPGATNVPLRVVLKNAGNAVAETLTTKLLGGNTIPGVKSNLQTLVGNTENTGNVIPGEIFTTTFFVNVDPSTVEAGRQVASMEIQWTQATTPHVDRRNSFAQTLELVYNIEAGPNYLLYYIGIPWTYIIIAIIVGLLIVVFLLTRRKRIRLVNSLNSQYSSEPENMDKGSPIQRD